MTTPTNLSNRKPQASGPNPGKIVTVAAIVLLVLHHDLWFWNNPTLVLGFLPIGLAYHAMYSIAAAVLWAVAVRIAWPSHDEPNVEIDDNDRGSLKDVNTAPRKAT